MIGFLMAGPPKSDGVDGASVRELRQIGVEPGGWGGGAGSLPHEASVRRPHGDGFTDGVLECREADAGAQAFHARHGWRRPARPAAATGTAVAGRKPRPCGARFHPIGR